VRQPGRGVLLTREVLDTLVDDWAAAPGEALGAWVGRIAVDHVGDRGASVGLPAICGAAAWHRPTGVRRPPSRVESVA
jgi:hypothetical protein